MEAYTPKRRVRTTPIPGSHKTEAIVQQDSHNHVALMEWQGPERRNVERRLPKKVLTRVVVTKYYDINM